MRKHICESGRTMVEILAVLAIMAALTIVSIQGYRYAVWKHRFNETLYIYNVIASNVKTQLANGQLRNRYKEDFLSGCAVHEPPSGCDPMVLDMRDFIDGVVFLEDDIIVDTPSGSGINVFINDQGKVAIGMIFADAKTCVEMWKIRRDEMGITTPSDTAIEQKICGSKEVEYAF